ncbi:unnamed protein product [Symbiodinium sp. CCMP2592]|nr:unnamed protein product [Symbiodinium sp. CCMP2592]
MESTVEPTDMCAKPHKDPELAAEATATSGTKPDGAGHMAEEATADPLRTADKEQTLMKFGEVDQAMNILHANCAAVQQNMQAVDKISQDLRKEVSDFGEKSASEMDHLKELRKVEAERLHRTEVQIATLQKNMQSASNKIAALSSARGVSPLGRGASPQRRAATPSQPSEEKDGAVYSHLLSLLDEQEQVRHKIGRFPRIPPN